MKKLPAPALTTALRVLPAWSVVRGKLHRELKFGDFVEAFAFMTKVALLAERANHHPDWSNVWNRVTIDLVTHEAKGITRKDVDLARAIDALAGAATTSPSRSRRRPRT